MGNHAMPPGPGRGSARGPTPLALISLYRAFYRAAIPIALLGLVSGGWFSLRAILVWGVGGEEYPFWWDLPVTAGALVAWLAATIFLMFPPDEVQARPGHPVGLLWKWGALTRWLTVFATPLCGLLLAVSLPLPLVALNELDVSDVASTLNSLLAVTISGLVMLGSVAASWFVVRGVVSGAELTPTELIVRGFFVTRKLRRDDIAAMSITKDLGVAGFAWWLMLLSPFLQLELQSAPHLTDRAGRKFVFAASNAGYGVIKEGIATIEEWREHPPE